MSPRGRVVTLLSAALLLAGSVPSRGLYNEPGLLLVCLGTCLAGWAICAPESVERALRGYWLRPVLAASGPLALVVTLLTWQPPPPAFAQLAWALTLAGLLLAVRLHPAQRPVEVGDVLPGLLFASAGVGWLSLKLAFIERPQAFLQLWLSWLGAWLLTAVLLAPGVRRRGAPLWLALVLGCGALVHGLPIVASPEPVHDAWTDVKYGTEALLHGRNPYNVPMPSPYRSEHARRFALYNEQHPDNSPWYPPGTPVSCLPVVALGLDHRWTFVLAWLGLGALAAAVCGRREERALWAGALVLLPCASFTSEQAFVDPLLGWWFAAGLLTGVPLAGGLLLALATTAKQSSLLLCAAMALRWRHSRVALTAWLGGTAALVLPCWLGAPRGFRQAVITGMLAIGFWPGSLCLPGFLWQRLGLLVPARGAMLVFLTVGALAAWRRRGSVGGLLAAAGFAHALANVLNNRALINYYELAAALLLLAAATNQGRHPVSDRTAAEIGWRP